MFFQQLTSSSVILVIVHRHCLTYLPQVTISWKAKKKKSSYDDSETLTEHRQSFSLLWKLSNKEEREKKTNKQTNKLSNSRQIHWETHPLHPSIITKAAPEYLVRVLCVWKKTAWPRTAAKTGIKLRYKDDVYVRQTQHGDRKKKQRENVSTLFATITNKKKNQQRHAVASWLFVVSRKRGRSIIVTYLCVYAALRELSTIFPLADICSFFFSLSLSISISIFSFFFFIIMYLSCFLLQCVRVCCSLAVILYNHTNV